MPDLFAYGTLCFPAVIETIIGRVPHAASAVLSGYSCRCVFGKPYPGILEVPGSEVPGTLYFDISPSEWSALDDWEDEFYERRRVAVLTPRGEHECDTYAVKAERGEVLSGEIWTHEAFERDSLAPFLARIRGR